MVKNSRSFETFSIKHLPPLVFLGIIEQTSFLEIDIRRGGENDVIKVSKTCVTHRLTITPFYSSFSLAKKKEKQNGSHIKKN